MEAPASLSAAFGQMAVELQGGGEEEHIARLREKLSQPGPGAAQKARQDAVNELLSMKNHAAHAVLVEALRRREGPAGLREFVLARLAERLANSLDPVFGAKNPDVEARAKLLAVYLPVLARLALGDAAIAGEGAPAATLQRGARECLLAMPGLVRLRAFSRVLRGDGADGKEVLVRAAGTCRDLGLVPLLGEYLEHPALGDHARTALQRLTLHPGGFSSKAELQAWLEKHRDESYQDLLEAAAWRAQEREARLRADRDESVRRLMLELIESWVDREPVRWKKIQSIVTADDPPGILEASLERLRDLLVRRESPGGEGAERLAFWKQLNERLARARGRTRALLLEVSAYLVAPGDAEERQAVHEALLAALEDRDPDVRLAAVRGLARFPGSASMTAVLRAAQAARAKRERTFLAAAMETLQAKDWTAPGPEDPVLAIWTRVLRDVLTDAELDRSLRQSVLRVLDRRDAAGKRVGEALDLLLAFVGDPSQTAVLRDAALEQLANYTDADVSRADRYVDQLAARLADPDKSVRMRAATLIARIPATPIKERVEPWTIEVLHAAAERLLAEPEEAVVKTLVESLKQIAATGSKPETVMARFFGVVEKLAEMPAEKRAAWRQHLVVDGLTILASTKGVAPIAWVRAGEVLLSLGERDAVRRILTRQDPTSVEVDPRDPKTLEVARRALRLTLATALRKPVDRRWHELEDEARQVAAAFEALERLGGLPEDPTTALLRLEVLAALGRHERVVALASTLARRAPAAKEEIGRAALLAAGAELARDRLDQARAWLGRVVVNGNLAAVLDLQERLAARYLARGQAAVAAEILREVVERTAAGSPVHLRRVLLLARSRLQAEPEARAAVLELLEAHAAAFRSEATPAELREEFAALLAAARNGSKG